MDRDDTRTAGEANADAGMGNVHRIWPGNGVPPGSEAWDWQERTAPVPWGPPGVRYTRNVVVPQVTVVAPPPGQANGTAVIIAPGGAFHFLMVEHEGHDMANWLTTLGVTALVLTYRLARTPDDDAEMNVFRQGLGPRLDKPSRDTIAPPDRPFTREPQLMAEEDGRQAIRFARSHAKELGIDPARIGIAGFSAGGTPAIGPAMLHDAQSRPDFAVGIYPVYRGDLEVPPDAPPLFLVTADDDASVAPMSTSRLYEAWHKSGAPVELHVFETGGHGFGMSRNGKLSEAWTMLLENWLRARKLIA